MNEFFIGMTFIQKVGLIDFRFIPSSKIGTIGFCYIQNDSFGWMISNDISQHFRILHSIVWTNLVSKIEQISETKFAQTNFDSTFCSFWIYIYQIQLNFETQLTWTNSVSEINSILETKLPHRVEWYLIWNHPKWFLNDSFQWNIFQITQHIHFSEMISEFPTPFNSNFSFHPYGVSSTPNLFQVESSANSTPTHLPQPLSTPREGRYARRNLRWVEDMSEGRWPGGGWWVWKGSVELERDLKQELVGVEDIPVQGWDEGVLDKGLVPPRFKTLKHGLGAEDIPVQGMR